MDALAADNIQLKRKRGINSEIAVLVVAFASNVGVNLFKMQENS